MIYICIPTHNEQQTVGVVLWKLRQVLTEFHRDYQLLVADDASTDKTTDVLEPYTRVLPLTVIRSDRRQGYAASLEMLLREAVRRSEYPKRDVIVTLQADFSEEPDDIVGLIKRMEAGADVAVGIKVGASKESRTRRLARSLSSFFTRKQAWPEGVVTPFDGYRAYRLHAVKRAIEEREGRRLLRYDGWAGHAELLRAVLPHARRVDTLNVEDRPDRLQRPRRERPFAAAWQVRAMASGAEPSGLVSVEELDRVAATASRSRERSVLNGALRVPARSGSRDRKRGEARSEPRGERGDGRERGRGERSRQGRPERGERGERGERPDRERSDRRDRAPRADRGAGGAASGPAGTERPRNERRTGERRPERPERPERDEARRREPAPEALTPEELLAAADAASAEGGEPAAPKKRRRRRRGRGGASAGADAGAAAPDAGPAEGGADEASRRAALDELDALLGGLAERAGGESGDGESGDAEVSGVGEGGEGGERKRRRRGGRRGGRGRRRTRADGEAANGEATGEAAPGPHAQGAAGAADVPESGRPDRIAGLLAPPPAARPGPEDAGQQQQD